MNQQYLELLNLTQLYLLQEFSKNAWIGEGNLETFHYFKHMAKKPAPLAPIQMKNPLPSPPQPPPKVDIPAPPPPPIKTVMPSAPPPKKIEEVKKGFELEKMTVPEPVSFDELRKVLGHLEIKETIPEYTHPVQKDFSEVVILLHALTPAEEELLRKMSEAIQSRLNHSCSFVSEKSWESLLSSKKIRWILGTRQVIQSSPLLSKHFKESTKDGRWFLGHIPFFMLADISLYIKEPSLKASLWKALCELLKR